MKLKLANSLTAGIARLKSFANYYQWLLTTKPDEIVDNEYIDYGTGGNNGLILNTTIATFDGTDYLQGEAEQFAGYSINDYLGTSIPTIDYVNDRVNITVGNLEWIELIYSDGTIERIWFQESDGIEVYSTFYGIIELIAIQDVFSTTPIDGEFIDLTGFENNVGFDNLQSACFPVINPTNLESVNTLDFTGIDELIFKVKLVHVLDRGITLLNFGGNNATTNGFSLAITEANQIKINLSNGVSNTVIYSVDISTLGLVEWVLYSAEIQLRLNGYVIININDVQIHRGLISIGGYFGLTNNKFMNITAIGYDTHIAYSELVGYFKLHYKEGFDNTVYDVSGNGNHFRTALWEVDDIDWNSFYGDSPLELILGYSKDVDTIILGLEDGTADAKGGEIQYLKNRGYPDELNINITIPIDTNLNEVITSGVYTWQELRDLPQTAYLEKIESDSIISRMIVKKKSNELGIIRDESIINDETIIID